MKRRIIPYDPAPKELARKLRKNSTFTEILLWNYLKGKQMRGYDFHRQKPIGKHIVDFFCNELDLVIEVDGESHYGNQKKDEKRQTEIEKYGVYFLRFDDLDVRHRLDWVLKTIEDWIDNSEKKHTPSIPLSRGDKKSSLEGIEIPLSRDDKNISLEGINTSFSRGDKIL